MAATNVQAFSGDVEVASNLAVDTNVLFVDSVNNRVGIGKTNPAQSVHVSKVVAGGVNGILVSNPDGNINSSAALKLGVSPEDDNVAKFGIIHERKAPYGGGDTYFCTNYANDTTEVSESDAAMTIFGASKNAAFSSNVAMANSRFSFDTNSTFKQFSDQHGQTIKMTRYVPSASNMKIATGSYNGSVFQWVSIRVRFTRLDVFTQTIQFDYIGTYGNSVVNNPIVIGDSNGSSQASEVKVYNRTSNTTYEIYLQIDSATTIDVEIYHRGSTIDEHFATLTAGAINETGLTKIYDSGTTGGFKYAGGNVGIGQAAPANLVHIRGAGPQLLLEGATNENANLDFSSGPSYRDKFHRIQTVHYALSGFATSNFMHFRVNNGGESGSPGIRMTIRGDGKVGINNSSPSENLTVQHPTITPTFGLRRGSYGDSVVYMKTTTGFFTTVSTSRDCVINVGKGSGSNRSIDAVGTINASGTDYAEYMKKSRTGLVINKGDIVGINNDAELTNVFSESIQFVVKSTNPSYIGGDTWKQGTVNPPEYPSVILTVDEYSNVSSQDANLYSYWEEQNMYANTEQLNTFYEENEKYLEDRNIHREPYDRIAFCGQVPVNVYNAVPGQYIIPTQTDDDTISYELTNTPTFEQYRVSIGKVVKIEEDGRAFIIVKIS